LERQASWSMLPNRRWVMFTPVKRRQTKRSKNLRVVAKSKNIQVLCRFHTSGRFASVCMNGERKRVQLSSEFSLTSCLRILTLSMSHDKIDKDFPTGPWPIRRNKPEVGVHPCRFCRLDCSHCYIGQAKQSRRALILRHRRVSGVQRTH
jgi:hypothetical protein